MDTPRVSIIGTSLGSGGTITVTGTETCGLIEIQTGSGPTGGDSIQFNSAVSPGFEIEIVPLDATTFNSAATARGGGGGTVIAAGPGNWAASTSYKWSYRAR